MSRNESVSLDVQMHGPTHGLPGRPSDLPSFHIIPDTHYPPTKIRDFVTDGSASHHEHLPVPRSERSHERPSSSSTSSQTSILGALSVGAPLIASVVSSCTSGICADLTAVLGPDPLTRPARASAIMALLWCALLTSLGSTMTAVAGLAMSSGYHDSHVGVTKRIVRFVRQWHSSRRSRSTGAITHFGEHEMRAASPAVSIAVSHALSAITDTHKDQHARASFRAAVVSARLLGLSVALLCVALALYLFLLYPISVAASTLCVGILTAAVAAAPLLPIIWPSS